MTEKFPKRPSSDVTAETGINIVSTIFNDQFGWVFRRTHQEHDFGVDAFVDYVTEDGRVTGQFIAVQVKTGTSYLSSKGSMHWYRDTKEHLNYFLNLPTPILLVICDPLKRECYWSVLKKEHVDFNNDGWRHPIPKSQILCAKHIDEIARLFGNVTDHVRDFEQDQTLFKLLMEDAFIQYSVPRADVQSGNLKNLKVFLERITRSEKLTLAAQGKLYISTYGYEDDDREVHQIKEIRRWCLKARRKIKEWYLCAGNEPRISTILWMAACTCKNNSTLMSQADGTVGYRIEFDLKQLQEFLVECFDGLNEATEKWGWSKKYNYEISKKIQHELFRNIPYPELKNAED